MPDRRFSIHGLTVGQLPRITHVMPMPKTPRRQAKPNVVIVALFNRRKYRR